MTDVVHGPGGPAPLLLGAGLLEDEPGTVWRERRALDEKSRDGIERVPIMCVEDGKLKVDLDAIDAKQYPLEVRALLEKFKNALVKKNIQATRRVEEAAPVQSTVEKVGQIFVRRSDAKVDYSGYKLSKRRLEEARDSTPYSSSDPVGSKASNNESPVTKCARRVEVVRVPDGLCAGDRIGVFNSDGPPNMFIDIPTDAYPDMRLDFERPPTPVKFLLLDGSGYKVCGNFLKQHAVRLTTHRGVCKLAKCSIMGCHGDKTSALFKRLGQGKEAADYHEHWKSTSRESLRSHGMRFRMLASRV